MAPPPGMYQRSSGTRPRGTPTGRRSLFPAQSMLRIFFAMLLLACSIYSMFVVGLIPLSRCSTFFFWEGLFFLLVAAQEFEVTAEDVVWANKVRSHDVLFPVVCLFFFGVGLLCFCLRFHCNVFGIHLFLRSLSRRHIVRVFCNRRQRILEMFVCLFVWLVGWLFVCLFVRSFVCLFVCVRVCLHVFVCA